jgi:serine/threonine-protein kinase
VIGQVLCGRYRVLETVGSGAMGTVYRAWDERMSRPVALKMLPQGSLQDDVARARFRREALLPAPLSHANVCTVYDFDTCEGIDCLLLEYVPGKTLSEMIEGGPLSEAQVLRLAEQLVSGLAAAHGRGVLHRDLKPGNIRVTPDGTLKIVDFGLAKLFGPPPSTPGSPVLGPLTESRSIVGTLPYMAPEMLAGGEGDARSDIYSSGVVLYQMATGRLPFPQVQADPLVHAVLNTEAPSPRSLRPSLSRGLEEVIRRAMQKNPTERFATAPEMAEAIAGLRDRPQGRAMKVAGIAALVLLISLGSLEWGRWSDRLGRGGWGSPRRVSIAVLPFTNSSGDASQDRYAIGMTNEIIDALTRIQGLDVAPWEAVAELGAHPVSPENLARRLGIQAYVGGAYSVVQDHIRIRAHVVRGPSWKTAGATLEYESSIADRIALQDSLPQTIAREVDARLTSQDRQRLSQPRGTVQPLAYQQYLSGIAAAAGHDESELRQAIVYFQRAIDIDSRFAPAHAGLANVYYRMASEGFVPATSGMPAARAEARRAVSLDPNLAEAHSVLGAVLGDFDWNWTGARRELELALELSPGDATAHERYADLLTALGEFGPAVDHIRRAVDLDPVSARAALMRLEYGSILLAQRSYPRAIEVFRALVQDGRASPTLLENLGLAYWKADSAAQAVVAFQQAWRLAGLPEEEVSALWAAFRQGGIDQVWRVQLARLAGHGDEVPAYAIASLNALLGRKTEALQWLGDSCRRRESQLVGIRVDPRWDALRADRDFRSAVACVGLPTR